MFTMVLRRDLSLQRPAALLQQQPLVDLHLGMRAHHLSFHTGLAVNLRGRDASCVVYGTSGTLRKNLLRSLSSNSFNDCPLMQSKLHVTDHGDQQCAPVAHAALHTAQRLPLLGTSWFDVHLQHAYKRVFSLDETKNTLPPCDQPVCKSHQRTLCASAHTP